MHSFFKNILLIFFVTAIQKTIAQTVKINYVFKDSVNTKTIQELHLKNTFSSSNLCENYITQLTTHLHGFGYISASIDSVYKNNNSYTVELFLGYKYFWKKLQINDTNLALIKLAGADEKIFNTQPFSPYQVSLLQNKLLDYFVNNGYPFASIYFNNIDIENEHISAELKINKGILYTIDSIKITGNAKISKSFLYKYLNIAPGSIFNAYKLNYLDKKLDELPFMYVSQPHQITMLGSSCYANLFLDNKKNNQVDAIIGLLPNSQQKNGDLMLTVDAKLLLQNTFSKGETIQFLWQQLQPKSPRIFLNFQYPYIFNSLFNTDFSFNLFKKDSAFITIQSSLGLMYKPNYNQQIKFAFQVQQSNLLDIDTFTLKIVKKLPDILDITTNSLVMEWNNHSTDYKFNPTSGHEITLTTSIGNRKVRKNNTISQLVDGGYKLSSLYDSIPLKSYQIKLQLNAAKYFKISKFSTIKTQLNAGLLNSQTIYRNEMFQIGGLKLLRGFDEESIYTNKFIVATTEYRYIYSKNAYFNGFIDFGYTHNSLNKKDNQYIGFGGGLGFETKQGIFNFTVAAGTDNKTTLNLKQTKIHIGFVSLF
jgi:outer membrane protein assembly factor BamA